MSKENVAAFKAAQELSGTPAVLRAVQLIKEAVAQPKPWFRRPLLVSDPKGSPSSAPQPTTPMSQIQLHHTVYSSTKVATTGETPAAICLSMVTVWLHAFIRIFAWLHCDAGMNGIVNKTELHPMNLSRLIVLPAVRKRFTFPRCPF